MTLENESLQSGGQDTPADSIVTTETPISDTVKTTETAATETKPVSRVETIRAALEKGRDSDAAAATKRGQHAAFQPRQQGGKFAPGAPKKPDGTAAAPQVAAQPGADAGKTKERPALPKSWRKEMSETWGKLDPDTAAAIAAEAERRDQDALRGVEQYKSQAQQAQDLLKVFEPFQAMLRAEGATPAAAIGELMKTAALLRTGSPASKATLVVKTMRQFGIPLEHIAHFYGQAQQPVAFDPHISALAEQVQRLQSAYETDKQAAQTAEQAALTSEVEAFKAQPGHEYFEQLRPAMATMLRADPPLANSLQDAYDKALRLDPQLFQAASEKQRQEAERKEREEAAKRAQAARQRSVQVSGAPRSGPQTNATNPGDRRAVISAALAGALNR